jgi:chromosomal replication initiator protein
MSKTPLTPRKTHCATIRGVCGAVPGLFILFSSSQNCSLIQAVKFGDAIDLRVRDFCFICRGCQPNFYQEKKLKSAKEIWEAALGELQLQVNKPNYDTWLKDTTGISYQGDIFVVGVPNVFVAEWLKNRLYSLIKRTVTSITGKTIQVEFEIRLPSQGTQLTPAYQADGGTSAKLREPIKASKINPKYTFDTFVAGEANRLAYAAALEVSEEPGQRYNPLFIYGDTGTGKTHLLHAIGNAVKAKGLRILLATAEQFTSEFITALKNNRIDDFHLKFRSADVLLVDDIQFLSGKAQTQEYLVHIFNDLYDNNCQMVVTSDRPPKAISSVTKKLRSRLEWGLVADISPPDMETRLAILRAMSQQPNVSISPEVLRFLATQFQQNVRELQGALNRVATYTKLSGSRLDMQLAMEALSDVISKDNRRDVMPTPRLIMDSVASYYGIDSEALVSKQRDKKTALARQVSMYLLREQNHCSLAEIGKILGNRDHTTILHGYEKIAAEIKVNPQLNKSIKDIRQSLGIRKT